MYIFRSISIPARCGARTNQKKKTQNKQRHAIDCFLFFSCFCCDLNDFDFDFEHSTAQNIHACIYTYNSQQNWFILNVCEEMTIVLFIFEFEQRVTWARNNRNEMKQIHMMKIRIYVIETWAWARAVNSREYNWNLPSPQTRALCDWLLSREMGVFWFVVPCFPASSGAWLFKQARFFRSWLKTKVTMPISSSYTYRVKRGDK